VPKKIDTELSIFYINFIFIQARLEKLSPFEMGKFISRHFSCNSICCQQSDLPTFMLVCLGEIFKFHAFCQEDLLVLQRIKMTCKTLEDSSDQHNAQQDGKHITPQLRTVGHCGGTP